jgi:pyruvate kinase
VAGVLISVDSKRSSGGQSVSKLYAARIADPEAAISAVRKYANASDEHMQILVETSVPQLRAMRVPNAKVRRIESVSKLDTTRAKREIR